MALVSKAFRGVLSSALTIAAMCLGVVTQYPQALHELVRVTRLGGIVCCTVREEYWQETHFPEVLNQIVESGRAALKQLCEEPYVHSEESTCKMVVLEVTRVA
jgi:ubiquinone/menaquinone biosynthesis C-methylase UbiE